MPIKLSEIGQNKKLFFFSGVAWRNRHQNSTLLGPGTWKQSKDWSLLSTVLAILLVWTPKGRSGSWTPAFRTPLCTRWRTDPLSRKRSVQKEQIFESAEFHEAQITLCLLNPHPPTHHCSLHLPRSTIHALNLKSYLDEASTPK